MPRLPPDDIPHAATTDHRILRRPQSADDHQDSVPDSLVAWREPAAPLRDRDLAVAYLIVCLKYQSNTLRDKGTHLLNGMVVPSNLNDATLASYLAGNAVEQGDMPRGVALARRALETAPDSGHAAFVLAIALQRSGDLAGAEREYLRATNLDPSLKEPWMDLAKLYQSQARMPDVRATIERYLAWNPQSILFRLQKARIFGEP
jgi:tetratricopeptide (TPR) repeat protein